MNNTADKHLHNVRACHVWLQKTFGKAVDLVIITGTSGPNALEHFFDEGFIEKKLPPRIFPSSSVAGHSGRVRVGTINGVRVAWFRGRVHTNEDPGDIYRTSTVVRALALWGVRKLILTNASGALNPKYKTGTIAIVDDHITLFAGAGPLAGDTKTISRFGERFLDMAEVYDRKFQKVAWQEGKNMKKLRVKRNSVYTMVFGPQFEARAEIRLLKLLADLVGMSSVHEAQAAYQAGMRVLLLSMVTNPTFDKRRKKKDAISHEENILETRKLDKQFAKLIGRIIRRIGKKAGKR